MEETILFVKEDPVYGKFSNFYPSFMIIHGKEYRTVEHFYQSMKAYDKDDEEKIRKTFAPWKAKKLGNNVAIVENWEGTKEAVMKDGLLAKFSQNQELKDLLLSTEDKVLIEHAPWGDSYWGDGGDGNGMNRLGVLLMEVRDELSNE